MFKLCHRMLRLMSTKIHQQQHSSTQISHTQKLNLLNQISQKVKLGLKPSIIISDEVVKKKLTYQQKMELGLFIPKSPFNTRLTRFMQKEYLPKITNELYQHQKQNLQTYIKILQNNLFLQKSGMNLNHYINVIYKDIYARYLISKNIGIQWEGFYANTGILNQQTTHSYDHNSRYQQNYSILLDFIQNNAHIIQKEETIGLYSFYQSKFIHPSEVGIQKIKRLGYYMKQQLTSFGKYENEFNVLKQKNNKVYMLIMVERLQKLINPNAISINPQDKYIMLKKHTPQQDKTAQYLIASLDTYKQHEKYFKTNQYEKHNTFDAKYILGMKCMSIPIVSQISGYIRSPNPYIVNSNCHIADFERARAHKLKHSPPFTNEKGQIKLKNISIANSHTKLDEKLKKQTKGHQTTKKQQLVKDQELSFHMVDHLKLTKTLQKIFTQEGVAFMDFYDVLDDQLYFCQSTKEILNWRIGQKYSIQIPQENTQLILKGLEKQKTIVCESKIKIQNMNIGKKPRQRRRFRKQRKQKLKEITQHLPLSMALSEVTSISLSSLSQSLFVVPIFFKKQKIIPYQKILSQEEINFLLQRKFDSIDFQQKKLQGYQNVLIYANQQLLKALLFLKNLNKSKEIHNVIIEPQQQTQQLIPNALHLNYLINKSKMRGRRLTTQVKNNINLIKLHPTLAEQSKNIPIQDLIEGIVKGNSKRQYGLGFEALRLWTARNDSYLGDRIIQDQDVNKQLRYSESIRTIFWNLLSILPSQIKQVEPQLYLSKFILDLIDSFIISMEDCYKSMNIHEAYLLTNDFFSNVLNQIYVKTIRDNIIAYPNLKENQEHFFVIRRILELVAVISPLFPFTSYHISRKSVLKWPQIVNTKFYQKVPLHNQMIETRVKLINKLRLNKLQHAQVYCQSLKQSFSARDLQLFFNVDSVTFSKPDLEYRTCSLALKKNNSITSQQKLTIYLSEEHCIRCDNKSKQAEHLCKTCINYLQEQIAQPLAYFPQSKVNKLI